MQSKRVVLRIVAVLAFLGSMALGGVAHAAQPRFTGPVEFMQIGPDQTTVDARVPYDAGMPTVPPSDWHTEYKVVITDFLTGEKLGESTSIFGFQTVETHQDVYKRWLIAQFSITNNDGHAVTSGDNTPDGPPVITAIEGNVLRGWGSIGEEIWLYGTDLGLFETGGQVVFEPGHHVAEIVDWGPSEVIFKVPKNAEATSTVHVETIKGKSAGFPFWVIPNVTAQLYDGHGQYDFTNPLEDTKVELKDKNTGEVLDTAYSDPMGHVGLSQKIEKNKEYRLTVTFESEDGKLAMERDGKQVSFSRDFKNDSSLSMPIAVDCKAVDKLVEPSMDKDDIDNCASVWHYLQLNRAVAKYVGYDLTSKLTVDAFASDVDSSSAYYQQSTNSITLGEHLMDDDQHPPVDSDPVPWDFRKNRESHEFGHAMMNVVLGGGWVGRNGANHNGYLNADTSDSLSEGFAEYWAMLVDDIAGISGDPELYDGWGKLATTNRYYAWSPVATSTPTIAQNYFPQEEFAAAGVVRRLHGIWGGGPAGFAKVINGLSTAADFTDYYDNLVGDGVAKATLDPVFASQGFFSDVDGDWTWDPGEPIGAGPGAVCSMLDVGSIVQTRSANTARRNRPYEPNAFVKADLAAVTDPTTESVITVTITHAAAPWSDYHFHTTVTGPSGYTYLDLPPGATAVISVAGPKGTVSPDTLVLTHGQWEAARAALDSGPAVTATFRFPAGGSGGGVTSIPIEGGDRYETAIACSRKGFSSGAGAVIIATGANFPDALGASALAGVVRGPILLQNPKTGLTAATRGEIARLFASTSSDKRIYIAGGTGVVSGAVESALKKAFPGATLTRLGGRDRYATARLIAREARDRAGTALSRAIVVSGKEFPDALLAGPVAYRAKRPVLLVVPSQTSADAALTSTLTYCGVTDIDIIGSTAAVSAGMKSSLDVSFGSVERPAESPDRYAQGVAVADWAATQGLGWSGVGLATGQAFPDALAAGPVLGEARCPLLLTPTASMSPAVRAALASHRSTIGTVRFFGGVGAILPAVRTSAIDALK